jgi:predicted  nucleic acid-binding Zn-ribbon protein
MVHLAELQEIEDILLTGKRPRGTRSLNHLEAKKTKLEKNIETRVLRYYRRIRERYDDAVVPIEEGYCTACGMMVPPHMQQEIKRHIGINVCGGCGRILICSK